MQRYSFQQFIAYLLMFIGWLISISSVTLSVLYINKTIILGHLGFLPRPLIQQLTLLPDWIFYTPAGVVFLLGLVFVGIGHILQVSVDNARNSHETLAILDMIRVRTTPY